MSLNLRFARVASTIAMTAIALVGVTEARAAEGPRCLPTAEMKAHLNAKGQFSLVAFEQQGSDPSKFVFRAYYATKDGTVATEVVGDEPRDPDLPKGELQIPKELCKVDEFTGAKLAQNAERRVPSSFFERDVPTAEALSICEKRKWGDACGAFNDKLRGVAQNGRYPMLRLTAVGKDQDGSFYLGSTLTVIASPDGDRAGTVELSTGGVGKIKYDIRLATYTKDGLLAMTSGWPLVVASNATARAPEVAALSIPFKP